MFKFTLLGVYGNRVNSNILGKVPSGEGSEGWYETPIAPFKATSLAKSTHGGSEMSIYDRKPYYGKGFMVLYLDTLVKECHEFSEATQCVRDTAAKHGGELDDVLVVWKDWKRHKLSGERFLALVASGNIPTQNVLQNVRC